MTDMKSAQQTNSILKNKTTILSTQKMGESESLKFDKFMKCYNSGVYYTYRSQAHSKLWFVHKPHVK